MSRFLAGTFDPALGKVPNITPDPETGIGTWSEEQIANLLRVGARPDGSQVTGVMALLIQGGFKNMTETDARAIAAYLKTIPAVKNVPEPPQELPTTGGAIRSRLLTVVGLIALLGGAVIVVAGLVLRRWRYRRI